MRVSLLLLLLVLFQVAFATKPQGTNLCTHNCDVKFANQGSLVTWCGSDGLTHTTTQGAITLDVVDLASDCYSLCGISVKFAGTCGCPNGCYNSTANGVCHKDKCVCSKGWTGADCSLIECPNPCSKNGKCKSQDKSKGGDFCECGHGFTGYDCSIQIPDHLMTEVPYGVLPFGEYNNSESYYAGEKNGDSNPVFNTSTMATIKINLSEKDLEYLINPENRRIEGYKKGTMWFDNGNIKTHQPIEFRLRGLSSRMLAKKSWNIKLAGDWNGVTSLALKAGVTDRSMVYSFSAEMFRMMKTQTYRVTFASLILNDRFYGVYSLCERFDKQFMKSRFNEDTTNLYQLGAAYYGEYWGSVPAPYQDFAPAVFDDIPIPGIEQQDGTGDWSDLTMLFTVLNQTSMGVPYVEKYFDYNHFVRYTSVDLATDSFDSYYGTGNNWMLVNTGDFSNPHWIQFATDFDNSFESPYDIAYYLQMTPTQLEGLINSGVTNLGGFDLLAYCLAPNPYIIIDRPSRPIANTIYQIPGMNATFTGIMTDLVTRLIFTHPGRLQTRLAAFHAMTTGMMARDIMFDFPGFSYQGVASSFEYAYNVTTPQWYNSKYSYLGSMFVANGHGTCDAMAKCVCNNHYSGPTCQTYTP